MAPARCAGNFTPTTFTVSWTLGYDQGQVTSLVLSLSENAQGWGEIEKRWPNIYCDMFYFLTEIREARIEIT